MEARASFMEAPAKGATVEERRLFVMRQLDALGVGHVVLGKYMLLDAGERCHGGMNALPHCFSFSVFCDPLM